MVMLGVSKSLANRASIAGAAVKYRIAKALRLPRGAGPGRPVHLATGPSPAEQAEAHGPRGLRLDAAIPIIEAAAPHEHIAWLASNRALLYIPYT